MTNDDQYRSAKSQAESTGRVYLADVARRRSEEAKARITRASRETKYVILFVIGTVLSWFILGLTPSLFAGWIHRNIAGRDAIQQGGTFGDAFGASNALFSALAFAAVAYSLLLQRREMRESRVEADRMVLLQYESSLLTNRASVVSVLATLHADFHELAKKIDGPGNPDQIAMYLRDRIEELDLLRLSFNLEIEAIQAARKADPSLGLGV